MLCLAKLVTFLITFLMTPGINAKTCPNGWFGEDCMFMCNCALNTRCDKSGACPGGKCAINHFGPGCQFFDYVSANADRSTDTYLWDGNSATCNPNRTSTFLDVRLDSPHRFMWFRIEVNKEDHLLNFTTKIDGRNCINEVKFPGKIFVDVTCDTNWAVHNLHITGNIVPDVCSIRISAGRNAALKHNAQQSSTFTNGPSSVAINAVDGNRNNDFMNGSCTKTQPSIMPWWHLTFNQPQILFYVHILNRIEEKGRLNGFTLEGYDTINVKVFEYVDVNPDDVTEYRIDWTSLAPIKDVKIIGKNTGSDASGILTLCEVTTFGETVCPEGTFGLWCSEACLCEHNELCNSLTGLCAPACPKGLVGKNCSLTCRSTCLDGFCRRLDGKCFECIFGYYGHYCEHACLPGFYGEECAMECSRQCKNVCDHVEGNCSCISGYAEPSCLDCMTGLFGENCTSQCSILCRDQECNSLSGDCFLCQQERSGKFCEDCIPGFFGEDCETSCSINCVGHVCEHVTGNCSCIHGAAGPTCSECEDGFVGEHCIHGTALAEKPTHLSYVQYWIFVLVLSGITAVACVCMFLWVKNEADDAHEEGKATSF